MTDGTETSEPIGVDFTASGLQGIIDNLQAFKREVRSAGRAYQKAFQTPAPTGRTSSTPDIPEILRNATVAASPRGQVNTSISGNHLRITIQSIVGRSLPNAAGTRLTGPRQPWMGSGPRQMLSKLFKAMPYALSVGNFDAYDDMKERYDRIVKRLNGPQPGERLASAFMTSRYGMGSMSPLMGKTLDLFGGQKAITAKLLPAFAAIEGVISKLGPYGLVIAAAVEAGKMFAEVIGKAATTIYEFAQAASNAINTFTRFSFSNGGSVAANSQLYAVGRAGGLSAQEISGIVQSIQSRITSDPIAMAAGMKLGVYNLPAAFGNQDLASQTLKVVQSLREIKDPNERLRLARTVGAEGLLPLTAVSDRQFALAQQDAATRSGIMTPDAMQKAADFQASMGRIADAVQNLEAAASPAILGRLTDFFNKLATIMNGIATWLSKNQDIINGVLNNLSRAANAATGGATGTAEMLFNAASGHFQGLQQSLDKNTAATAANTAALGYGAPGSYGRATRGDAAGSGMLSGLALRMSMDQAGFRVSTF